MPTKKDGVKLSPNIRGIIYSYIPFKDWLNMHKLSKTGTKIVKSHIIVGETKRGNNI